MGVIDIINDNFEYNKWANRRLLIDIKMATTIYHKDLPISFGSLHQLLAHLHYYNAKIYNKIVEKKLNLVINKNIDRDSLFKLVEQYSIKWLDWSRELYISSKNLDPSVITDLSDLYNHNIYHRGQISAVLAILGFSATSLDIYIYRDQMKTNILNTHTPEITKTEFC